MTDSTGGAQAPAFINGWEIAAVRRQARPYRTGYRPRVNPRPQNLAAIRERYTSK
jgi:hypothetical protein